MRIAGSLLVLSFLLLAPPAGAADVYVATTGNDALGDGSIGNPFRTIQHGVESSAAGDTVRVLAGTYLECIDTTGRVVTIHAEDANPANTKIDATGLDCGGPGFPGPVVALYDGCKLEGFTVTGGGDSGVYGVGSISITANVITTNTASYGGGIFVLSDDFDPGTEAALIEGNVITANTATYDAGGIWVSAADDDGVLREVQVTNNVITDNTAQGADPSNSGHGGGAVFFTSTGVNGVAKITVANNFIDGNTVTTNDPQGCTPSYGGGLWAVTFGAGMETIDLLDNEILNNSSTGDGGGASIWVNPEPGAAAPDHAVTVSGNTVTANHATAGGGGGLDLYLLAQDLDSAASVAFSVSGNEISGNTAGGAVDICTPEQPSQVLGGGGALVSYFALRTDSNGIVFELDGNTMRSNGNDFEGGGAKLFAYADSDPDQDGVNTGRATSTISFHHNLVASNGTHDAVSNLSDSGGVAVGLQAYGDALATVNLAFDTVSFNSVDSGGAAGIGIASFTDFDSLGTSEGAAAVSIDSSIVSGNLGGYGIAALIPGGSGNLTIDVSYTDVFGQAFGNYGPVVGDRTGTNGNISADPLLNANFLPDVCSPTIDAADPAADFSAEPAPNGQRANMGHLGGTSGAAGTLPDINGDDVVDGVDLLAIATSFASVSSSSWYSAAADLDKDLDVDGDDLAFVAAYYGRACP
jgi:hypothetical protein